MHTIYSPVITTVWESQIVVMKMLLQSGIQRAAGTPGSPRGPCSPIGPGGPAMPGGPEVPLQGT